MSALLEGGARRVRPLRSPTPTAPRLPSPERFRVLLGVALRPSAVVLFAVTVLIGSAMVSGGGLNGVAGAVAAGWLGVHLVPLTIGTTPLSVFPLAPTLGAMYLTTRSTWRATTASSDRTEINWVLAAAIGGPFAVTVLALAVVKDASASIALAPPDTLLAFGWVVVLHGGAAAVGVIGRTWRHVAGVTQTPDWLPSGFAVAASALRRSAVVAAVLTLVSLAVHWSIVVEPLRTADGFVGGLGLVVLSLGYLPNVLIATAAVLTGAQASIGSASVGLFAVHSGPIPGLPVLAGMPTGPAAAWYPVLLGFPIVIAILLGRDCAARCDARSDAVRAVLVAAVVAGLAALLAGALCGGRLGTFGQVGVAVGPFAAGTLGWFAVVGAVSAWFATRGRSRVVVRRAPDISVPVPVPVPAEPPADSATLPDTVDDVDR